jgi:hypothetical protein
MYVPREVQRRLGDFHAEWVRQGQSGMWQSYAAFHIEDYQEFLYRDENAFNDIHLLIERGIMSRTFERNYAWLRRYARQLETFNHSLITAADIRDWLVRERKKELERAMEDYRREVYAL